MLLKDLYQTFIAGTPIKRRAWEGYWLYKHGRIEIHTKDGDVLDLLDTKDVLFTLSNVMEDDWEVATKDNSNIIKDTIIIAGFPGVGKTEFFERSHYVVVDAEKSTFCWSNDGRIDPADVNDYIDFIKPFIGKVDFILVPAHNLVRQALQCRDMNYTLVYPDGNLKDEYLNRYYNNGSSDDFVKKIDSFWADYINEIEREGYPHLYKLSGGEFLSDVINYIKGD